MKFVHQDKQLCNCEPDLYLELFPLFPLQVNMVVSFKKILNSPILGDYSASNFGDLKKVCLDRIAR